MHYYFITGTSYGLGKALAEKLVQRSNVYVFGIARTCTISHKQYEHIHADLGEPSQLKLITELFKKAFQKEDQLYLINNAGIVDPIRYTGKFSPDEIQKLFQVNLLSVVQLTNAFLQIPVSSFARRVILNISSGAANKVSDGWALYGASKAGVDHFSLHVARELEIDQQAHTRIFSVAPGVVDTRMQQKIRETPIESFSTLNRFLDLDANKQLVPADQVAQKLLQITDAPELFAQTILSVRDF
ncbi:MAG: SDR family NAD(P)-dependent oxidoreductase [Cytophaga sp.]|uniref:SDR family NAD(P)-dependent oxidoreductase n=1 Tax=Cytophaga sp. TaxID=29535 RepID=UPI003F7F2298